MQLLLACVWTFICTINLVRAYKHYLHGNNFDWFDTIWIVCLVLYVIIIADTVISKIIFSISNGQLTVTRQSLFKKKQTVYEIVQMQHTEIEERPFKKIAWLKSKQAVDYAIRFSYFDDERRLTGLPDKVQAEQLLAAIATAQR